MKLGILCTMINGFGQKGFYNTQEIGLGRALAHMGHDVTIYKACKKAEGVNAETIRIEERLTIHYLPIGGFGAHGWLKASVLDSTLDGLLCFSDNQIFLPHIYRFCQKNGICFVPYVGTAHSLHSGLHAGIMDALFQSGTLKIFKSNRVIAKTEAARRELLRLGVQDIVIGPVGLDTAVLKQNFAQYDCGELRRQYGFSEQDVIICNVSRLEPEKRPLDLLDILAHIRDKKNFRLVLVGEGTLYQAVQDKIQAEHLDGLVKLIDRVPYAEMWKLYTLSDYFVNLNRREIFGMAIMEAIYYRTSVAAINAPGPSGTLKDMPGHCLCTDDREVERWLTSTYPKQEALDESAHELLKRRSWNVCAELFEMIVKEQK